MTFTPRKCINLLRKYNLLKWDLPDYIISKALGEYDCITNRQLLRTLIDEEIRSNKYLLSSQNRVMVPWTPINREKYDLILHLSRDLGWKNVEITNRLGLPKIVTYHVVKHN